MFSIYSARTIRWGSEGGGKSLPSGYRIRFGRDGGTEGVPRPCGVRERNRSVLRPAVSFAAGRTEAKQGTEPRESVKERLTSG
jgi:hypothetical protein